jgi:hypothetical protein
MYPYKPRDLYRRVADDAVKFNIITVLLGLVVGVTEGVYEGVSKSFRTGRLERELQMVQLSASRHSCIATLWVSLVCLLLLFRYRLSPETSGYTLEHFLNDFH